MLLTALALILVACQAPIEQAPERSETLETEGEAPAVVEVEEISETPQIPEPATGETAEAPEEEAPEQPTADTMMTEEVVTFVIEGENFKFLKNGVEAPELRVNYGDLVRIEFTNNHGMHDWVLDEFNAATEIIAAGETNIVEFVANQRGTFEYYCSVGSHRENGMVGAFVVE